MNRDEQRIAMFGGSFNPVHAGHLSLCRACRDAYRFDKFLLVPDNLPPHKPAVGLAPNADRLAMLELAVQKEEGMEVSTIEYELGGTSYTVRTLRELHRRYPDARLYLIIGSDMLLSFRKWRSWEEILSLATIIAAARHLPGEHRGQGNEFSSLEECRASFGPLAERIELLRHPVVDISSTELRALLAEGRAAGTLLPDGVYEYIQRNHLYESQ